ncbi:MAG TPA: beta-N-acetylhexosaminidase [Puia sp.]|nr:beta-N-acetylhexosaminidase [Puia sp.]
MRRIQHIGLMAISLFFAQRLFALDIIPYPLRVESKSGSFNLGRSSGILYAGNCQKEAEFLKAILEKENHGSLPVKAFSASAFENPIICTIDATLNGSLGNEGYDLTVSTDKIQIRAANPAGVFYAIQTIRQLITGSNIVPCCHIFDKPRFAWRSFMLDEGRYFKGEQVVKQLLDQMALLKMNVFHWHLTDDQGWRIEIKKYPLLTKVGSRRDSTQQGVWPSGWKSDVYDGVPHQGYYTQQQIKDIVKYAAERHITIIPEIEMPGHASAAIAAYPYLGAENKSIKVPVKFGVQYNVFNVADPKVQKFIENVLDEVLDLFPSKVIHIGGDEVRYDQWKNSPAVMDYIKQQGLSSPADLQVSFTNNISQLLESKHRRMMGWNEILGGKIHDYNQDGGAQQKLSRSAIIQFWVGDTSLIRTAAASGYDIVNSFNEFTYLDYDEKSISVEKAYSFEPVPAGLPAQDTAKILGLGCQMWGEWIPTVDRMNERVYPRLAAYAEVGWTSKGNKDYGRFIGRLPAMEDYWKSQGIHFTAVK